MAAAPVNTTPRPKEKPGWVGIAFIAAFVLTAVIMFAIGAHLVKRSPGPEVSAIAVLPFAEIGPNAGGASFAARFTRQLADAVSKTPALQLTPAQQAATFIEGTAQTSGDRVRVAVRLERASDRRIFWSQGYAFAIRDSSGAADEILRGVLGALHLPPANTTPR
jgi:TolB-like protein